MIALRSPPFFKLVVPEVLQRIPMLILMPALRNLQGGTLGPRIISESFMVLPKSDRQVKLLLKRV